MSDEYRECRPLSAEKVRAARREIRRITSVHQKALGEGTPLYVVGSVPLWEKFGRRHGWRPRDMDLHLADVTS
jgi:hypothetical protein